MNNQALKNKIGVVVIGRNEGDRLKTCLQSLRKFDLHVVYVDSGSTDGSVENAKALGVHVHDLDMSVPFTAARARNEGFEKLLAIVPNLAYVQFLDGDCEVVDSWIPAALAAFEKNEQLAVVCGRRKERFPEATFYNYICDLEWNTPVGEAKACGGDALMKVNAFQSVGGYNPTVIAGEEPELCVRLRSEGWKIERIDADMTMHDAAIRHFSQWWKRSVRAGHAFAQGAFMHGNTAEKHRVKESKRARTWGLLIPAIVIIAGIMDCRLGLLASMVYPLQLFRLAYQNRQHGWLNALRLAYFLLLGKFAELQGQLSFHYKRLFKKQSTIIEYK